MGQLDGRAIVANLVEQLAQRGALLRQVAAQAAAAGLQRLGDALLAGQRASRQVILDGAASRGARRRIAGAHELLVSREIDQWDGPPQTRSN